MEGFVCPECLKMCDSIMDLSNHYKTHNVAVSFSITDRKSVEVSRTENVDILMKLKKNINLSDLLVRDDPVISVDYTREFSQLRSESQVFGFLEYNRVILRLKKLISYFYHTDDYLSIYNYEKNLVHWVDDKDVPICVVCGVFFNFMERKHHCRLCGGVICGNDCSVFLNTKQLEIIIINNNTFNTFQKEEKQAYNIIKPATSATNTIESKQFNGSVDDLSIHSEMILLTNTPKFKNIKENSFYSVNIEYPNATSSVNTVATIDNTIHDSVNNKMNRNINLRVVLKKIEPYFNLRICFYCFKLLFYRNRSSSSNDAITEVIKNHNLIQKMIGFIVEKLKQLKILYTSSFNLSIFETRKLDYLTTETHEMLSNVETIGKQIESYKSNGVESIDRRLSKICTNIRKNSLNFILNVSSILLEFKDKHDLQSKIYNQNNPFLKQDTLNSSLEVIPITGTDFSGICETQFQDSVDTLDNMTSSELKNFKQDILAESKYENVQINSADSTLNIESTNPFTSNYTPPCSNEMENVLSTDKSSSTNSNINTSNLLPSNMIIIEQINQINIQINNAKQDNQYEQVEILKKNLKMLKIIANVK